MAFSFVCMYVSLCLFSSHRMPTIWIKGSPYSYMISSLQHGFELHRSTYTLIFFNKCIVGHRFYTAHLANHGLKTVFSIHRWESCMQNTDLSYKRNFDHVGVSVHNIVQESTIRISTYLWGRCSSTHNRASSCPYLMSGLRTLKRLQLCRFLSVSLFLSSRYMVSSYTVQG